MSAMDAAQYKDVEKIEGTLEIRESLGSTSSFQQSPLAGRYVETPLELIRAVHLVGWGAENVEWPQAGSLPIHSGVKYHVQDEWTHTITDSGYKLVTSGGAYGLVSPNMDDAACGLTILDLYESGLALTTEGYVFDSLVNGVHEWVTVPDCTGATGIAAEICALADGELHNQLENASGQRIVNIDDQAFLLTPCSPFPAVALPRVAFQATARSPGSTNPGRSR